MSKKDIMNKEVKTSLGITIYLITAVFLILIDFIFISRELDSFGVDTGNSKIVENVQDSDVDETSSVLTEQEALAIGNDLYKKASDMFIHGSLSVEKDENSQSVLYRRNDDGSYIVSNDFDNEHHAYEKLIVSDITNLLSEKMFNEFCSKFNVENYQGGYYRIGFSRGRNDSYNDTKLEVVSITNDIIIFDAVSSYFVNPEERFSENAVLENKTCRFELIKENNSWKVNEFILAY